MSRQLQALHRRHRSNIIRRAINVQADEPIPINVLGNISEPITASYVYNNEIYNVHGEEEISYSYLNRLYDEQEEAMGRVEERSSSSPPPNYSPVRSNDTDDDYDLNLAINTSLADEPQSPPEPQVDVAVLCHICSCTFTDIQNYNSNFVTSSMCNHAVCFKCYVSIVFNNESYKCSLCNKITPTCRAYNNEGYVELTTVKTVLDKQAIKRHWSHLDNSNKSDETTTIQKLRAELAELQAQHSTLQNQLAEANAALQKKRPTKLRTGMLTRSFYKK